MIIYSQKVKESRKQGLDRSRKTQNCEAYLKNDLFFVISKDSEWLLIVLVRMAVVIVFSRTMSFSF